VRVRAVASEFGVPRELLGVGRRLAVATMVGPAHQAAASVAGAAFRSHQTEHLADRTGSRRRLLIGAACRGGVEAFDRIARAQVASGTALFAFGLLARASFGLCGLIDDRRQQFGKSSAGGTVTRRKLRHLGEA
jgi:hypothetical protein